MENPATATDRMRSFLVVAATVGMIAFNWLAATGRLGSDPAEVSAKYTTLVTPAGYAFSIWSLIYLGMIAFTIYQMLPSNLARFRPVRSFYIFSCALNCAWLYFWHREQVAICFFILVALSATLFAISRQLRRPHSLADVWTAKEPFGLYFGWVTAATLVNFAIVMVSRMPDMSATGSTTLGVVLIFLAAAAALLVRARLTTYLYPLAVAWALTAIGVKQSGHTAIVVASALGVIACLIAAISVVLTLNSSTTTRQDAQR